MTLRQSILFFACCGVLVGALYGLWYQFGPEGMKPDYETMRKYRINILTEDQLRTLIADARKKHADALVEERENTEQYWKDYNKQYHEWEAASAQCRSDEAFKMKNEKLCNNPPHQAMLMTYGGSNVASEEQYIEWEIMFWCDLANTVREARRYGCLSPK